MMRYIVEQIRKPPQARRRKNPNDRRKRFLERKRPRFQMQRVDAFGNR